MPRIIINLFGEKVIDWSCVAPKDKDESSLIPLHVNQQSLNFMPYTAPTLF